MSASCAAPASMRKFKPIPGTEFDLKADLVLLAMGFVSPVHEGLLEQARRRARPARQCRGQHAGLQDLGREGVRRRRHAPRPVAGGLGDPRGPADGARHRQAPDGRDDPAALNPRLSAASDDRRAAPASARAARLRRRSGRARRRSRPARAPRRPSRAGRCRRAASCAVSGRTGPASGLTCRAPAQGRCVES